MTFFMMMIHCNCYPMRQILGGSSNIQIDCIVYGVGTPHNRVTYLGREERDN
jgi:hypothetical protein